MSKEEINNDDLIIPLIPVICFSVLVDQVEWGDAMMLIDQYWQRMPFFFIPVKQGESGNRNDKNDHCKKPYRIPSFHFVVTCGTGLSMVNLGAPGPLFFFTFNSAGI